MKEFIVSLIIFFNINLYPQNLVEYFSPKPTGTWDVGKRSINWVDSSRIDIIDSSEYRNIPTFVWYPAILNDSTFPDYPLDKDLRIERGKYLDKKIGVNASQYLQNLKVWSQSNAPAVTVHQKFPVLIFGPGHTWISTDYSTLIEEIVSHGYIVIGYNPIGFTGVTKLSNGKIINGSLTVHQQEIFFEDAIFILKNLYRLENGWLKEIIDINQIGAFGHSLGGAAATVLAGSDSKIKAFVNIDGDLMGSAINIKIKQPGLLISNDERIGINEANEKRDRDGRERSEYRRHSDWVRATDNAKIALRLRISGTRHLNFTDLALIPTDKMLKSERKDKLGMVDGKNSIKIMSDIIRHFFDVYLKNGGFFTQVDLEEKYPEIQVLLWKGIPYY